MSYILAGIGAGLVSALLFAVVITGSPLAVMLSYLAPLPVFIATLGWRHRAGLIAAFVGALALGLGLRLPAGAAYAIGVALPAWGIAYLSLLGRTDDRGVSEWYPMGRLLLWIVGTAALVTLIGAMTIFGSHDVYRSSIEGLMARMLAGEIPGLSPPRLPEGLTAQTLASTVSTFAPFAVAASMVPMLVANLWIAAKAVQASGRLPRPWPDLPMTQLPRETLLVGAVAAGLTLLPGFFGFFGLAILGGLVAALLLNGLAAMHALSRGKPWRLGALSGVYVGLFIGATILGPMIALFGLADLVFRFRDRRPIPPPDPV
jgi:hypothetical protein